MSKEMTLEEKLKQRLIKNAKTVAIVCDQFGDTGKGKFVDLLSGWADIIARGTGGANAGHTIEINGKQYITHILPAGILHDKEGKYTIIGKGVAFDPRVVIAELDLLDREGMPYNNLRLSLQARLMLPQHLVMDRIKEAMSAKEIGTTGRGIGPCYEDHVGRRGLVLNDVLNKDIFARKLQRNLSHHLKMLQTIDPDGTHTEKILQHAHLESGKFFSPTGRFDIDAIIEMYTHIYADRLKHMIMDTEAEVRAKLGRKNILLEGAQGHLLSVEYGFHPGVTSSDASLEGLTQGVGLRPHDVDIALGIVKAPYMTRVGAGPFPTEFGGSASERHCQSDGMTMEKEQAMYPDADINHPDGFLRGIAIRAAGGEKGATTGRPRRVGRLDLPLLRYAAQTNGNHVILTKMDVMDDADSIEICESYKYKGPEHRVGQRTLCPGDDIYRAIPDTDVIKNCTPVYKTFPGWKTKTSDIREYDALPSQMRDVVDYIETSAGVKVMIVSVGPDREQTIVREEKQDEEFVL
jgi:adenylosuccinate synthase